MPFRTALVAAFAVCGVSAASAADPGPWIAFAMDRATLSGAFAEGVATRADAERIAMEGCARANDGGDGCTLMAVHEGGCLADARSSDGDQFGYGGGDTLEEATSEALKECSVHGTGCEVHTNFCAGKSGK